MRAHRFPALHLLGADEAAQVCPGPFLTCCSILDRAAGVIFIFYTFLHLAVSTPFYSHRTPFDVSYTTVATFYSAPSSHSCVPSLPNQLRTIHGAPTNSHSGNVMTPEFSFILAPTIFRIV